MANQQNDRENNSAFIADLLEKLRRQMGAPEAETDETTDDTPVDAEIDFSPEANVEAVEMSDVTDSFEDAYVSVEEITEESATDDEGMLHFYADGMPEPDAVPAPAYLTDETAAESPSVSDEAPVVVDEIPEETTQEDGDQYSMDLPPASPTEQEMNTAPADTVDRVYARTVVPDSGRISESARHPVDERYRSLFAPPSVPVVDPEQFSMQIDAAAPDMPVPDEDTIVRETPEEEPVSVGITSGTAFTSQIPDSIWNTPSAVPSAPIAEPVIDIPAIEEREPVFVPMIPVEEPPVEEPVFHAVERLPRDTFADVDFDATRDKGVLREKVLLEPLESIGGEHADVQIERWQQEIGRKRRNLHVRSIIIGIAVALLALFELIPPLTEWVLSSLLVTRVPGAIGLIDLQLLIIVCIVGYRQLYRGLAALRFGRVIPETLAFFAATASLTGSAVFYIADAPDRYLFALTGSVVVLSAVLADLFRVETLGFAFRAYAAPGARFAGVLTHAHEHRLIHDLYPDETDPVLMETEPTSRVDGFVAAMRERVEDRHISLVSLSIAGGVALADLIVLLATRQGVTFSFWSALVVFVSILPLSLFAVRRFLAYMLTSRIAEERIGVTGESAVYRHAACGVMSFSDTEAFPNGSVRVNGIKLCGDFRLDKALYLVSSLFDKVGGPLNSVFRISTADVRISDDVTLRALAPEGIEAQINREDVCVGTRTYLEGVGIEIFRDIEDERAEQEGSRVLYVSYRGMLAAKFYVKYDISPAFEKNVEYYAKHGVSSVIVTADPLLNDALLDSISYISDYDVRFVKRDLASLEEERNVPREVELITYGPRKTLRRMPFFFKRYVKGQRLAFVLAMIGMAVTVAAVPLLLAMVPVKTALFAVVFQLLALLPVVVIGVVIRRMNPNP